MKKNGRIKLFFNVFRFMTDDLYYDEVINYYWFIFKNIKDILHKSRIYWFLMEEQILDD